MTQCILFGSFVGSTTNHETKDETHWWAKILVTLDSHSGKMRLQGYGTSYYGEKKKMSFLLVGSALSLMEPIRMAKIHYLDQRNVCYCYFRLIVTGISLCLFYLWVFRSFRIFYIMLYSIVILEN